MSVPRRRFPRRRYWHLVDDIISACELCDPGDPDSYQHQVANRQQYRYRENRHFDLEAIYLAALSLRDALGEMR